MYISKEDVDDLCEIARTLNDMEELELWNRLNEIINNITE